MKLYTTKEFTEEILNKIPTQWNEISLRAYKEIMKINLRNHNEDIKGMVDEYHSLFSVLTNKPKDELDSRMDYAMTLLAMNKVNKGILATELDANKLSKKYRLKDVDKYTTNEFIFMMQIKPEEIWEEDFIHQYISSFLMDEKGNSLNNITKEEVLDMDVVTINTAFFLLIKNVEKFTKKHLVKQSKIVIKNNWKRIPKIVITLILTLLKKGKNKFLSIFS